MNTPFKSLLLTFVFFAFLPVVSLAQYGPAYNPYGTSGPTSTQASQSYYGGGGQDDVRCPVIPQNLYRGLRDVYSGGDIYRLQNFLITAGFLSADSATGFYGARTAQAVAQFQASAGIYPTTGTFGPRSRQAVAARCSGGIVPSPIDCPVYPMAYPQCPNGAQPTQTKDYRGCLTGYTCPVTNDFVPPNSCKSWNDGCNTCSRTSVGAPGACTLMYCPTKGVGYCTAYFDGGVGYGTTPTISSFSGPTTLAVNQQGTWSVIASDPQNRQMTYNVTWGDEGLYGVYTLAAPSYVQNIYSQNTTYTHTYSTPGTYTVRITARNATGYTATATATVVVTSGYTSGISNIRVITPNTYTTYQTGTTLPITWTDSNTYIVAPRYDIYLRRYIEPCTGYICPLGAYVSGSPYFPDYSQTIAINQYGTNYSWTIPTSLPVGNYVVEVCPTGSDIPSYYNSSNPSSYMDVRQSPCDRSDSYFTISNNGSSGIYPTAALYINPSSGNAPLSTAATITLGLDPNAYSACGTLQYGTLEWGDGYVDTITYLGCSGTTVSIPVSHTYTTNGTYTARLMRNGQTTAQITVYVGTGTTGSGYISNVVVSPTSVVRGGQVTTSYQVSGAPANTSIGLELVESTTGTSYGYIALQQSPSTNSYTWTVPVYTSAAVADSPYVDGNKPLDGKTVYVRAKLYTPSNACFGYCGPGSQPTTLATAQSNTFTIGAGSSSNLNPTFTVTSIGNRSVTVTTSTPVSGTACGANGTLILDYGDGTSVPVSTTFSGSQPCANESRSFTYQFATTGSKTLTIRNNVYPYQIYTTQTIQVN